MGQNSIAIIPHDFAQEIERDPEFGISLIRAIMMRRNPNIPIRHPHLHYVALGQQFSSNDNTFVSINDGAIEHLTVDEQICLSEALRRFRKKRAQVNRG
jgi:hypothetical protein